MIWWCLVALHDPVYDIQFNYDRFIMRDRFVTIPPKLKMEDYRLLGYFIITSPAMKSSVFEALFATI